MRRLPLAVLAALTLSSAATADDFVPFVIPPDPAPAAALAFAATPIGPAAPRVEVRDGHFVAGGRRVRFWGVNCSFAANFPATNDAPRIAARLAAAGVNNVRLHHMDTASFPRGIWDAQDPRRLSVEALTRLDHFIAALARHGVYVDLNLHVGRVHSHALGLPDPGREMDKLVTIFTPALVEAQRVYATALLGRVNPLRGLRYADDPAIALVEITNENSLFMWGAERSLRTLPPHYAAILREQYNAWLRRRYGSSAGLRAAWSRGCEPAGTNVLLNGALALAGNGGQPAAWHLEQHAGAQAALAAATWQGQPALRVEARRRGDEAWHLQFNQSGLRFAAGRYYTLTFQAAAEQARPLTALASMAHAPWNNLGLDRDLTLGPAWATYRCGFTALQDDTQARVGFVFGGATGPFYLADVRLQPGGQIVLDDGEELDRGSVGLYADNEVPARSTDRLLFLAETEKAYFDGMRDHIRTRLGCRAPVTGTIGLGPLCLHGQRDMDFIDAHAYWRHPSFPRKPWDPGDWVVAQDAMTDRRDEAVLFLLAANRLSGKPFTVTEYNHPAPNDFQVECVPLVASFAALQDWDGVWLYSYSHNADSGPLDRLESFFDIRANPAKWGFMAVGAHLFREAGLAPLGAGYTQALAPAAEGLAALAPLQQRSHDTIRAVRAVNPAADTAMLGARFALVLPPDRARAETALPAADAALAWSVDGQRQGFYAARGPRAEVYVGHAAGFAAGSAGRVTLRAPAFAAVTLTALDGRALASSGKLLVAACGRCENVGMGFNATRETVGHAWGQPPVRIEAATGEVSLPAGMWKVTALGPDGLPARPAVVLRNRAASCLVLSPASGTMWYLAERE